MSEDEEAIDLAGLEITPDGKVVSSKKNADSVKPSRYSATLLSQYQKCPASAYARITKQPENKSLALVNGIALHEAIEGYIKRRDDMGETYKRSFTENSDKNNLDLTDSSLGFEKVKTDAQAMIINAKANLDLDGFVEKLDPELCEVGFSFERNGRLYVGKMDLIHMSSDGEYSIIDAKSSKVAPAPEVLNRDLQFTLYHEGSRSDPTLPTNGKMARCGVWWHLRGKNVAKDETGKTTRKVADKKYQYFFTTTRTDEDIQDQFRYTIEPVAEAMEAGVWYRNEKDHCGWCSYYDKAKGRCRVELPKRK